MGDRRRNMRAEACRSCGTHCEAGQGYLYCDMGTSRRRAGWFVKCPQCHEGKRTRTTGKMERDAASRPAEPAVRPWSVASVRAWAMELAPHAEDRVALYVAGPFGRETISYRDRIGGGFTAPDGRDLIVGGKPLSTAAAAEANPRVAALVAQVDERERAGADAAAAQLQAAGIEAAKHPHADYWSIKLGGMVSLGGPHIAVAIELALLGDYFAGHRLSGWDRRSGVSLPVCWTVAELLAQIAAKE